jgi:hypothetical protein
LLIGVVTPVTSAKHHTAQLYDLHCFESAAEHLEVIDSLLAVNKYHGPVAEHASTTNLVSG